MPYLVLNDPGRIPGVDMLLGMRMHRTHKGCTLKAYANQA